MTSSATIRIPELPSADCVDDATIAKDAIIYISQEFDSEIDFVVNSTNLLSGYDGTFAYPVFAFLRSVSNGVVEVLRDGQADIPIFLQQYSFSPNSPHHALHVAIDAKDAEHALVSFRWCPHIGKPSGVPSVDRERVDIGALIGSVSSNVAQFKQKTAEALVRFLPAIAPLLNETFSALPSVDEAWKAYRAQRGL